MLDVRELGERVRASGVVGSADADETNQDFQLITDLNGGEDR